MSPHQTPGSCKDEPIESSKSWGRDTGCGLWTILGTMGGMSLMWLSSAHVPISCQLSTSSRPAETVL